MPAHLDARLRHLEAQAMAHDLPTWEAMHAAQERLCLQVRAFLEAWLHGHTAPEYDEAQSREDTALLDRWRRAHGTYQDPEGARARLHARLTTLAARHAADAADPPGGSHPPH